MPYELEGVVRVTQARIVLAEAYQSVRTQLIRMERIENGLHKIVEKAELTPAAYTALQLAADIRGLLV